MTREEALSFLRGEVRRHIPDADDEIADRVIAKAAAMSRDIEPMRAIAKAKATEFAMRDSFFGVFANPTTGVQQTRIVTCKKGDRVEDILAAMACAGVTREVVEMFGGTDDVIQSALNRTAEEARSGHCG